METDNVNGGLRAHRQGSKFEQSLAALFGVHGVAFDEQVRVPAGSVFGMDRRADFLLTNLRLYPDGLYVECRWQDSTGSAEEKLPYLVDCIRECYDLPAIVVHGGQGMREGAIAWLKRQVDGTQLVGVMSEEAVFRWLMRNGLKA